MWGGRWIGRVGEGTVRGRDNGCGCGRGWCFWDGCMSGALLVSCLGAVEELALWVCCGNC